MEMYQIFQQYVINYCIVAALFALGNVAAWLYYGNESHERWAILTFFNQYKGLKLFWVPLMVASVIYPFVWISLFLAGFDAITEMFGGFFGSLEGSEFTTWLGTVPDGYQSDYFLLVIFIGILGAKACIVFFEIASILRKDELAVTKQGTWGAKSKFIK